MISALAELLISTVCYYCIEHETGDLQVQIDEMMIYSVLA